MPLSPGEERSGICCAGQTDATTRSQDVVVDPKQFFDWTRSVAIVGMDRSCPSPASPSTSSAEWLVSQCKSPNASFKKCYNQTVSGRTWFAGQCAEERFAFWMPLSID